MHLDNDVIEFFRQSAGGRGYQTLINSALRVVMEKQTTGDDLKAVIQRTIRDEFARRARTKLGGRCLPLAALCIESGGPQAPAAQLRPGGRFGLQ